MRRYNLKSRFRRKIRGGAATKIQRAYRRRRIRTYTSRKNKTAVVKIGRRPKFKSLHKRVAALEISSKKHYDYVLTRTLGVPITAYGASNGTQTNESFSQILAIQPRHLNGDIPPASGSARGSERNTREGVELFCTKVRIRGRILGIRPVDVELTKGCVYSFTDVITGTNFEQTWDHRQSAIRAACFSRVHIVVLSDTRPSKIDPITGVYLPNDLPVQPQNPLQGLFQAEGLSTNNTLELLGFDSALRNYTNNRFKIIHHSTLTFDYLHTSKWFDITLNINKKLIYKPNDPSIAQQGNTDPVNYNLLFYVSSVPAETIHAASSQFVMNDVRTLADPPTVPPSYDRVNLLAQPNLQMLSARTYFKES